MKCKEQCLVCNRFYAITCHVKTGPFEKATKEQLELSLSQIEDEINDRPENEYLAILLDKKIIIINEIMNRRVLK